jgi:hypothetical protein
MLSSWSDAENRSRATRERGSLDSGIRHIVRDKTKKVQRNKMRPPAEVEYTILGL